MQAIVLVMMYAGFCPGCCSMIAGNLPALLKLCNIMMFAQEIVLVIVTAIFQNCYVDFAMSNIIQIPHKRSAKCIFSYFVFFQVSV